MRVGDSLLKLLGLCLLAGVLAAGMLFPVVGALGVVSNRASDAIDSVSADLVSTDPALVTTVADANGKPIAYLYDQYRIPVTSDQISPTMKAALISIEDRRFYEHNGVDWRGTLRAAVSNQTTGDVQGASTLTQQYVKNYLINVVYRGDDPDKKLEQKRAQEQTITRKLREARIAIQLEQKMTKDEILTGYLNIVEFAYQVYGIGAAAHAYFHTTPDKLTVAQSALLAGMVNNPSLYNPWQRAAETLKRRNVVIDKMVENQKLSADAAADAKKEPLGILPDKPDKPPANCVGAGPEYGFFCQYVEDYLVKLGFTKDKLYSGGYTIKTSFDANATHLAKVAAEDQIPKDADGIANTMAIIKPGKDRHQVIALVANRDYGLNKDAGQTQYGLPSGISNKFGAGSIYKIFTAAAYLEKGGGIMNTIQTPNFFVSKVFKGGAKSCPSAGRNEYWYCLKNSGDYQPEMNLQTALALSPNTGFVGLEEQTGVDAVVDMASRLGLRETMASNMLGNTPDPKAKSIEIRGTQAENFKSHGNWAGNASFTLSPAPLSTLELANVGATLMSGGMWCPPSPIVEVLDRNGKKVDVPEQPCEQSVPETLANTLVVGLSKDSISGTAQRAASGAHWTRPMMGKTGTTQEHKSAGFVGATPQLAGAVLVFNDSPQPRPICDDPTHLCGTGNIFGGKTPAQTWFEAMNPIMEGQPELPLPDPDPRYLNGGDGGKVPNVIGKSQQEATQILKDSGFQVAAKPRDSDQKKGIVVSQSPRGNALAGATVTIYVSTGIPPSPTTEPGPGGGGGPPPGGGFPGNGNGRGGGNGGGGGGFPPLEPWITIPNPRP